MACTCCGFGIVERLGTDPLPLKTNLAGALRRQRQKHACKAFVASAAGRIPADCGSRVGLGGQAPSRCYFTAAMRTAASMVKAMMVIGSNFPSFHDVYALQVATLGTYQAHRFCVG